MAESRVMQVTVVLPSSLAEEDFLVRDIGFDRSVWREVQVVLEVRAVVVERLLAFEQRWSNRHEDIQDVEIEDLMSIS
jgi:hypothetical protein